MFQRTTAQAKIAALRNRVRVVQGGTSSSKTFSILPILITYAAARPNSEISVVAETIPHLRRGAMRDFIKIMEWTGNYNPDNWNKSSFTYRFANGSFIEFFSASDEAKLRGARRDVLFVNEANNIPWEAYYQLAIRTRRFIYIDYNPTAEFWAHTELIGRDGTDFIILNYKDNEALEHAIVKEIEAARDKAETSEYWANWWRVYGLGEVGSLQGVIFNNWSQIDELPKEAKLLGIGLDFGFTNDPTAAVAVYQHDGRYIVDELIYETGLLNSDIAAKLKGFTCTVVADSAEPKSIEEIRRLGIRIKGANKGTDSVRFGIQLMQEQEWLVTARSTNVIKELRAYSWETDKTGKQTGNPIGSHNHSIDGLRYWALDNLHKTFTGSYSFA
jgi:phage terminase large subunit